MKKIILAALGLITPVLFFAQQTKVERSGTNYAEKLRPAIHVIAEPPVKDMSKAWEKYVKDVLGQKMKSKKNIYSTEPVVITQLTNQIVHFYSKFEKNSPSGTSMYVFVGTGTDVYLSPSTDATAFNNLEGIVKDFLRSYLPEYYNGIIAEATKTVEKNNGDISSYAKNITKDSTAIVDNKAKITSLQEKNVELEKNIETAKTDKAAAEKLLIEQKKTLENAKERFEKAKAALL